jgi:hypothetical protein
MWKVAVAVVVGLPALYVLYTLWITLRLVIEAWRLKRRCAPRRLKVEWKLFVLFPVDLVEPIVLTVTLHRGERRFSFTLFRSLISDWRFTRVKVETLALSNHLCGRVAVEPKDDPYGIEAVYMPKDQVEVHTFGSEEMDARYRLREDTSRRNAPHNLALLCSAFTHPDVRTQMDAFGGSLAFEYGYMSVTPGSRDQPFLDGIEQVARLADALDDAVKGTGPYR